MQYETQYKYKITNVKIIFFKIKISFCFTVAVENEEGMTDRANLPMIRGGLNGSIADILEASGYGTETDFKFDEDLGLVFRPENIHYMFSRCRI